MQPAGAKSKRAEKKIDTASVCARMYIQAPRNMGLGLCRFLDSPKQHPDMRDDRYALTMAVEGLKQGMSIVPEEWHSELTQEIDKAAVLLNVMDAGQRPELVGLKL